MSDSIDWYKIQNEEQIDSPSLLIYPERINYNIELLKSMIDDINRLRPHVKTHKTKEIAELQLKAGITKFKCATIAEAEMLGDCEAPDVLLAYQLVGAKLGRFVKLIEKYSLTKFSAIVDCLEAAEELSKILVQHTLKVDVFIDLNLGMGRTGLLPGEPALSLYRSCVEMQGLSVQGFHGYDGHVREIDIRKRKEICDQNFKPIASMIEKLSIDGYKKPRVVIGGSPSFPVYAQYPDVECSPGTFILWDKGYGDSLPEQKFLSAAVLLTRIVSLPESNKICVDLGYKAVASENPLDSRVFFLDAPELNPASHSEEHLVLRTEEKQNWKVGDVLYGLPIHICPTLAMYDRLMVVKNHEVCDQWEVVARKR